MVQTSNYCVAISAQKVLQGTVAFRYFRCLQLSVQGPLQFTCVRWLLMHPHLLRQRSRLALAILSWVGNMECRHTFASMMASFTFHDWSGVGVVQVHSPLLCSRFMLE